MSVRRNTTYNLAGALIPLVVSFVAIPIYLGLIGAERYGVLALAWLLLGYFSIFDLGLSKATAQRIASRPDASDEARAATFWSALLVNALAGLAGAVVLYVIADFVFGHWFKVTPALRGEVIEAVPYLALALPVSTITGVLTGALIGRQRFLAINVISTGATAASQIAPILVAWLIGPHLVGLVGTALAARLLSVVILWFQCKRHVIAGQISRVSRAEILALLGFGGWVTVSAFVSPMMVILDRFIIGGVLGAVAVTLYTVPWQLAQRLTILPSALQGALYPRQAAATPEEQVRLTLSGMKAVAAVTTPLVIGGIFCMQPLLTLWLGNDFRSDAARVGEISLLGFWGLGMAFIPFAQVEARGHARTAALVHLIEAPVYLGILFMLLNLWGLAGAACAFAIRCLCDAAIFTRLSLRREAEWAMPLALAAVLCGCIAATSNLSPFSAGWLLAFGLSFATGALLSYAAAPEMLRKTALDMLQSLARKRLRPAREQAGG